jgi:hypothetical protein
VSRNGLAVTDSVDTFVRLRFQMNVLDGNAERTGKRFAHFRKVRPQLWLFQDDDGVDVLDRETLFVEQFPRMLQKTQAVRAFPFRIGVREMCTNVSKTSGAKQRIAKRMREYISVGMSYGAFIKRELDPADDQFASFRETMKIVPNAAAHAHAL